MAARLRLHNKQLTKEQITTTLDALKKAGFKLECDDKKNSQLVDAQCELEECGKDTSKLENIIYEMNDLDLLTKKKVVSFAKSLTMSEEEFNREHEKRKKLRELLISLSENKG